LNVFEIVTISLELFRLFVPFLRNPPRLWDHIFCTIFCMRCSSSFDVVALMPLDFQGWLRGVSLVPLCQQSILPRSLTGESIL
jgi:hypothetical protein